MNQEPVTAENLTDEQIRARDGQYSSDLDTVCVCGHRFGAHTAYKGTNGKHDCCEDCACNGYKRNARRGGGR